MFKVHDMMIYTHMHCEMITIIKLINISSYTVTILCVCDQSMWNLLSKFPVFSTVSVLLYGPARKIEKMVDSKEIKVFFNISSSVGVIIQAKLVFFFSSHIPCGRSVYLYIPIIKQCNHWGAIKRYFQFRPNILIRFASPVTDETPGKNIWERMGVISETWRVLDSVNFNSVSEGKGILIFKKENALKNGSTHWH